MFWSSLGGIFGSHSNNQEETQVVEVELDLEMASRAVVREQARVERGKQKNMQSEGTNRRALRDIGNLVAAPEIEGKPQIQITRPIERRFGAQLLAKDQAEVDKNNCKLILAKNVQKPPTENVNGGNLVGKNGDAKVKTTTKKERSVKVKNDAVTVICPDEEATNNSRGVRKVREEESLKKHSKTLTAILTARGKAACGLNEKPKDLRVDIDAADVDDELSAVEYVEDMYNFYKLTEEDGRVHNYMGSQPEINSKMRAILIDWLIEVHKKFDLMPESLYLAINIVDRFLAVKTVLRRELQLVGISSMLIACKYEEIWSPEVSDLINISDNAYVREQVLLMEKAILGKLEWYLTVPTPYVFLVRYIKASSFPADKEVENMAFFYAELGVMNYSTITRYSPSQLSASAVYAARCTLNKRSPLWTETLKHYTGYSEDQLLECAKILVGLHFGATENKLKAVYRKYSNPEREAVALFPPASSTPLFQF